MAATADRPVRAVALFLYNRPDLTARVFEAIGQARPHNLFLFADGPDAGKPGDANRCEEARRMVERVGWDCQVLRDFSPVHLGQRSRFESAFEIAFERTEEVIFLEDDTLPSPAFFQFCETLLEAHRHHPRVLSIGGSALHRGRVEARESYLFSRYPCSSGWATWRRAIAVYDPRTRHPSTFRDTLTWLEQCLEDPIAARYWAHLLDGSGNREPTWDYIWVRSGFLHNGLHAIPMRNLVSNLGFREDATHTREASEFAELPLEPLSFPLTSPLLQRSSALDSVLEDTIYSGHLRRALAAVRESMASRRGRRVS